MGFKSFIKKGFGAIPVIGDVVEAGIDVVEGVVKAVKGGGGDVSVRVPPGYPERRDSIGVDTRIDGDPQYPTNAPGDSILTQGFNIGGIFIPFVVAAIVLFILFRKK